MTWHDDLDNLDDDAGDYAPCPYCEADLAPVVDGSGEIYELVCLDCGARVPWR